MDPSPFFCSGGKQIKSTDFYRNPWCAHYDKCLNQAARQDLLLDCTQCYFKDDIIEEFSLLIGKRAPVVSSEHRRQLNRDARLR